MKKDERFTVEELSAIVKGIARQYSKDLVLGKGFDFEKCKDLEQDLWVKAYEIMEEHSGELTLDYISKCLWNKVTDIFRKDMRRVTTERSVDPIQFNISVSNSQEGYTDKALLDALREHSENDRYGQFENELNELIERTLRLAKSHSQQIYKFTVAKLKLAGYIPQTYEPEIDIREVEKLVHNGTSTVDCGVLEKVLGYKNGKTGGPGSFKGKKYEFRLEILSEYDMEDEYKTYYEVIYRKVNGEVNSTWVKGYSEDSARVEFVKSCKDLSEIITIIGE